ncbi:MAG: T9SS type A sorting domain-containing protein [Chitinophagaceae bacterium]|nr:T9SS type A sorting domain-containing protein [Chitinophagaceae bacterium]
MHKTTLLKQLLITPILILIGLAGKSQVFSESFDSPTFPPTGWVNAHTVGSDPLAVWEGAVAGAAGGDDALGDPFTVDPHSGAGMVEFRSYDFSAGNGASLASPVINLSSLNPQIVSFWIFREDGYTNLDSVSVYINTVQSLTGAAFLGKVNRYISADPVEAGPNGWYKYSFPIPVNFNTATNYIILSVVGEFGNNTFIDDVTVSDNPVGLCSGTPTAGVISGQAGACSGSAFTLTNTGASVAPGIIYAWQSSANAGGPWANIPGQTNPASASVSQTVATYYRFVDTCTVSNLSDISNVIQVTMNSLVQCYCQPPAVTLHSFVDDYITNVTISGTTMNSSNGTDALTGYTNVPPTPANNTADLQQITVYTVTATVVNDPGQVSGWVDFNNNGTFDAAEFFDFTVSGTTATGSIAVPANAVAGLTGFRIRARFSTFTSADACGTFGSGETEDYVVTIVASTALNASLVDIITPAASCNATNNVIVKLKNTGNQNIGAGAATVALYVTGANPQGPLTQTNASLLLPGDTATLTFACSFPVEGTNIDSAFIQSLAGDNVQADDSLLTGHITLPPAVNTPFAEDFEGSVPGWTVSQVAGSGNWGLSSTVDYPDLSPAFALDPKSGATLALFDSYNFSAGTVSRLSSNCINIPANANDNCGYVVGFYFTQDAQYTSLQDSMVVSISADGGNTFTRLGVVKRVDTTLSPTTAQVTSSFPEWKLYTFNVGSYAGQTVQFAFDAVGNFGNQMGMDSFFVGPKTVAGNAALAGGQESGVNLAPSLTQCTDANGWTYYSDANSARYLFGIQWDPASTGANTTAKAQATAKITVDRKWYSAENAGLKMATYTMQRYWDVDLNGASLTAPVNVRFFYSQRELDSINVAKNAFIAANPGAFDEGFYWFKTGSGAFVPSPTSVTYDSVENDVVLQNVNTTNATINGILYAQFNGVSSFSGGTATSGASPSLPLAVGLISFNAQRTGAVNRITWTTSQEINTRLFVIERSTDGSNFSPIGELAAAAGSTNNLNYYFIDNTPVRGINFYRLKIIDQSNNEKFSVVRNVRNEGTADIAIYPNPVRDKIQVNITSDKLDKAAISITDMNGRIVYTKTMSVNEGINYINVNTANFSTGTYVMKIGLNEDMVVRKFNKL